MSSSTINDNAKRFLRGPAAGEAIRIISQLREAGFTAYLAGGCVRDALLAKQPKDFDVATDATPDAIRTVFGRRKTLAFGASFGVVGVLPPHERGHAHHENATGPAHDHRKSHIEPTEVATFRSDGTYSDGRRPDSVHFGDARNDALRRDFTINGLFYDPLDDKLIDYVGGAADLQAGMLRTIGEPWQRFAEDKLRMLRAVRFATTLGFAINVETKQAIVAHADDIAMVSGERIGAEMRRVLASDAMVDGLRLLNETGLQRVVLPELEQVDLSHLQQLIERVNGHDFPLALAMLVVCIDSSKLLPAPLTDRWKLSGEEIRKVNAALQHWRTVGEATQLPWSQVQPVATDRDVDTIVNLATALAEDTESRQGVGLVRDALQWPAEKLDPPPLLTGNDLRHLGLPAGPSYGRILREIRCAQLDGLITTPQQAMQRAKEMA